MHQRARLWSPANFPNFYSPVMICIFLPLIEPHSVDLKGVGPSIVGVSERNAGESRPRALSQSAMHSFERGDRGNTQALAELAQVPAPARTDSV